MWTKEHRARHEPRLKDMISHVCREEVARWPEQADPPRSGQRPRWRLCGRSPGICALVARGGPCRRICRRGGRCMAGPDASWRLACSTA